MSAGAFVFVAAAAAVMLASFVYVRRAAAGQRARAGMPLCLLMPLPIHSDWLCWIILDWFPL